MTKAGGTGTPGKAPGASNSLGKSSREPQVHPVLHPDLAATLARLSSRADELKGAPSWSHASPPRVTHCNGQYVHQVMLKDKALSQG